MGAKGVEEEGGALASQAGPLTRLLTLSAGEEGIGWPAPPEQHSPSCDTQTNHAGHASLIRTIIGGVQIIDMMVLVVDITKGGCRSTHWRWLCLL